MRQLEIGPGAKRLPGFETLDVVPGPNVDHVGDARKLPFKDKTFGLVFASHVIEHVPWFQTVEVLREWRRVLTPGGRLELWTVDGYKVMKAMIKLEETGQWEGPPLKGWIPEKVRGNPYLWCSGRVFCYPKHNQESFWHRAMFTPKSLSAALVEAGFKEVRLMERSEVRGYDHGWINMGVCGVA